MLNIAVFVSGGGTNLQALIDAQDRGEIKNGKIYGGSIHSMRTCCGNSRYIDNIIYVFERFAVIFQSRHKGNTFLNRMETYRKPSELRNTLYNSYFNYRNGACRSDRRADRSFNRRFSGGDRSEIAFKNRAQCGRTSCRYTVRYIRTFGNYDIKPRYV